LHKILIMTEFASILLEWYDLNKRDLPWRSTNDPYEVWISEIILQQTQVIQGIGYYEKFLKAFPNVRRLAAASEDQVLKMWEGLGYYSRARNLHAAAKSVVNDFDGVFPSTYKDIIALKGIGPYTAAAIASISFGLPHAVVDGNVYRFLSRFYGIETPIDSTIGKKEFTALANELLDRSAPAAFNQALMEMGALVCKPKNPQCQVCSFNAGCLAVGRNLVDKLPVKTKKVKQRVRFFHYIYVVNEDKVYIERRSGNDIWKGLYQLPLIESDVEMETEEVNRQLGCKSIFISKKKHILSHQIIYAQFYAVLRDGGDLFNGNNIRQ